MKERLLELFKNKNNMWTLEELKSYFGAQRGLKAALDELKKEGLIFKSKNNCYGYSEYYDLIVGTVVGASKRGVNVKSNNSNDVYFINEIASKGAIMNDKVLLSFNKANVLVKDIIEEFNGPIIGEVTKGKHGFYIVPLSTNFPLVDIKKGSTNFVIGSIVAVKLITRIPSLKGEVIEVIGHKDDPDTKIKAIARDSKVNLKFSDEVIDEANNLDKEISSYDLENRLDLRDTLICTIDGKDAKDLDDAISVSYSNNIYTLGVHIADVSHYVNRYSKIDKEALKRGTSIYLTNFVIPMLPRELCNDLCSLNPNEDKLTMSCIMKINTKGEILDYNIQESIIKSSYRLNYDDVNDYFKGNHQYPKELGDMLDKALELSQILKRVKKERGEIDLEIKEPILITDENNKVIDIKVRHSDLAEKLIEDFMIIANETVASHIYYQDLPFIYRVHEEPDLNKLTDFINYLKAFGLTLKTNKNELMPKDYQVLLDSIKDEKVKKVISILMLRSMSKARYDASNLGHFGLASDCYTHFTSPIRRYPDLLVHRLLKMYIHNEKYNMDKLISDIAYIADQSSDCELKALELERKVTDIKIAEYMKDHIGYKYDGIVSSVTSFGIFVELDNCVEGLIRYESLHDDYYDYIEEKNCAIGRGSKKSIYLGDKIRIKVSSVDTEKGRIDFVPENYKKGESHGRK